MMRAEINKRIGGYSKATVMAAVSKSHNRYLLERTDDRPYRYDLTEWGHKELSRVGEYELDESQKAEA